MSQIERAILSLLLKEGKIIEIENKVINSFN